MEKIVLEKRETLGKKNKKIQKEGYIPSVIYNSKGDSINTKISSSLATRLISSVTSTTILDGEFDGKAMKLLVKEVDVNPLTDQIRHIAFFEIDENKEMVFTIPFNIIGISPAVKNNLGVLVEVLPSIDVRCKLASLVPTIDIDITTLEHPGQSISVNDIKLPEGIELINDELANATIVTVTEMQKEEEIVAVEETAEGEEASTESTEETTEEEK